VDIIYFLIQINYKNRIHRETCNGEFFINVREY